MTPTGRPELEFHKEPISFRQPHLLLKRRDAACLSVARDGGCLGSPVLARVRRQLRRLPGQFKHDAHALCSLACTNNGASAVMRLRAIAAYSGFNSMPRNPRPWRTATTPVVPLPANGSSTVPSAGHPALMQVSASASGMVAKC